MELQTFEHLRNPDEDKIFWHRWNLLETFISDEIERSLEATDESISILNLRSLKRGVLYASSAEKLEVILHDKQRLRSWTEKYKQTPGNEAEKMATIREAGTRLKMLLDSSEFDEGNLRMERRKAILQINEILKDMEEF